MISENADDTLAEAVDRVQHEASGSTLDVFLISPPETVQLMVDALDGDAEAARLFNAVVVTGDRIEAAPRKSPILCVTCPRPIKRVSSGVIFGFAVPATEQPSAGIGFAICPRCSADRAALPAKAATGLRRIWPDLRSINITHPAGGLA
jgi:hypothetical protein